MSDRDILVELKAELIKIKEELSESISTPFTDGESAVLRRLEDILDCADLGEPRETLMTSPFTGGKVVVETEIREIDYRDETLVVPFDYFKCVDTGKTFTISKLDSNNMWRLFRAYCEKKGFESFNDILPFKPIGKKDD